jgi:hypothetical protein
MHSGISRRGLLRGFAAAAGAASLSLAAGCDLFGGAPDPSQALPNSLDSFLKDTVALGDDYDAAIGRVPALAPILTAPRDAHRAHAKALAQAISAPSPRPLTSPTVTGSAEPATVIAALVVAETKGRDAAREACLSTSNRLAPLLGSIAAARACHLEVLQ